MLMTAILTLGSPVPPTLVEGEWGREGERGRFVLLIKHSYTNFTELSEQQRRVPAYCQSVPTKYFVDCLRHLLKKSSTFLFCFTVLERKLRFLSNFHHTLFISCLKHCISLSPKVSTIRDQSMIIVGVPIFWLYTGVCVLPAY